MIIIILFLIFGSTLLSYLLVITNTIDTILFHVNILTDGFGNISDVLYLALTSFHPIVITMVSALGLILILFKLLGLRK